MASPQHPTTIEKLPSNVLSDIFIRLLAKHLAQMRCVSKSWNVFLSGSSFIKSHLHRSLHTNDDILLFFSERFSFHSKPFTAHPSLSPDIELTNLIKLPVNLQSEPTFADCNVIGSVNGLICFSFKSHHDDVVCIWSPSLSSTLTLPSYTTYPLMDIFLRFGFDPKTDDYKVIKLTRVFRPTDYSRLSSAYYLDRIREWLQVEVYSMRKGSWELIPERFPSRTALLIPEHELFVDGHDGYLHWLGYIDDKKFPKLQTLVASDLNAESFFEIPLPESLQKYDMFSSLDVLGVLGGKLSVMSNGEYGKCDVWVMDEYGVADSWVKHYVFSGFVDKYGFDDSRVKRHVFPEFNCKITPFGFTLDNEFLFEAANNGDTYLALYDPIASKAKTFKHGSKKLGTTQVVKYWVAPAERR